MLYILYSPDLFSYCSKAVTTVRSLFCA